MATKPYVNATTGLAGAATLDRTRRGNAQVQRDPCDDACPPACPACGGLECFCRPRFFPGQLLTEDDLNLLMRYITGKNKLHNRYLHGWGVACGLEVVCDPCDPKKVRVKTGYAVGPCGDDIVLCNDQSVDICALIDDCTPPRRTVCDPPYERQPADCRKGNDRWVLAVCYDERPSRGLTALLGAGDSRCKAPCGCGGSSTSSSGCSSCGGSGCMGGSSCSCGGAGGCPAPKSDYNARPRRSLKAECEPTQLCEGYRFVVYPAPPKLTRAELPTFGHSLVHVPQGGLVAWMFAYRERLGPLLERLLCCVARARELLSEWGASAKVDAASASGAYLSYAEAMYAFAIEFSQHRCAFVGKIGRLYDNASVWRSKYGGLARLDTQQVDYAKNQMEQLESALLEMVGECFCSALLPPCPESVTSNCVPLAVVTLGSGDCRVKEICNWEQRKILLTWRTVSYWLSWLPWACLRHEIAKVCCGSERGGRHVMQLMSLMLGVGAAGLLHCGERAAPATPHPAPVPTPVPAHGAAVTGTSTAPKHVIGDLARARQSDDLFMHLLEEFDRGRSGAAAAPPWYALAARMADGSLFEQEAAPDKAITELRAELAEMQKTLKAQQARINTLSKKK